jgi:hypothetical protein
MAEKAFPLVFTFPELISGNGFVAKVEVHGRALLVDEGDGDLWIFGVQPGSVAGGGKDYSAACREFKKSYLSVLFDIASEAQTYDAFVAEVRSFFDAVNGPNGEQWTAALAEVRKGGVSLPGFGIVKAESRPPRIEVAKLEQRTMRPSLNQFDEVEIANAA